MKTYDDFGADNSAAPAMNSYTCKLDGDQAAKLKFLLEQQGFEMRKVAHAQFGASAKNISLTMYNSGKLLIQGKGTTEFIQYTLEPEILKEIRLGYEHVLNETENVGRIGVDESGKGDYFGPLVIAGLYADEENIKLLYDLNVKDSKLTSDKAVLKLTKIILSKFKHSVVIIGPEKYNLLYNRMNNLNKMLAWGHARVIENMLNSVDCKRVIIDQFGDRSLVKNALMRKGRRIDLEQMHKAERDIVVAGASIIARGKYLMRLEQLGEEFGIELPKGAGAKVNDVASQLVDKHGIPSLGKLVKLHFANTKKVIGIELKK